VHTHLKLFGGLICLGFAMSGCERQDYDAPAPDADAPPAAAVDANAATGEAAAPTMTPAPESVADRAMYLDRERAPAGEGWIPLIRDDLGNWTSRHDRPMSWRVEDGMLINVSTAEQLGVDIYSDEQFEDFEIYYEYRIPPGSNSGLYLRGRYEIQILDDYGLEPSVQTNGGIYSLVAPARNVSRPPGEWQSVYAKLIGRTVTVYLNGEKVVDEFELTRPSGGELDGNEDQPGPILLQGDHGSIDFRHLKVRPINS
jgi:hypothetical protein